MSIASRSIDAAISENRAETLALHFCAQFIYLPAMSYAQKADNGQYLLMMNGRSVADTMADIYLGVRHYFSYRYFMPAADSTA